MKLTAVFQRVPEGYIGFVEELPGANTQARTLKQAGQIWPRRSNSCLKRIARSPKIEFEEKT